jgi:hypothetical protein
LRFSIAVLDCDSDADSDPDFFANAETVSRFSLTRSFSFGFALYMIVPMMKIVTVVCALLMAAGSYQGTPPPPKPGFVVHFDFLSNVKEGRDLVRIAAGAGAQVINVVPPAHVWENKLALEMLDGIIDEISRRKLSFVFTRIDAAYPPDPSQPERFNYLYGNILTDFGTLPNGKQTAEYFRTTVGRKGYAEWMEEEVRYYAKNYGRYPNLLGINFGPFSEPFSSERGGFLEYEFETDLYEMTQYTPEGANWFHLWLSKHFGDIRRVNAEYGTSFPAMEEVPLPLNETDARFGKPALAYFDFARSLNDWLVENYERCRRIWHEVSGRSDVPFILQHCTGFPEKLMKGRPAFAAFDVPGWIAMSDAAGLSLYTNNGYPDFGHAAVRAGVNMVALARGLNKDVFVLEGGTEAPNVVLIPGELQFYGTVARKLDPRTYIYEFLKDKFDEPYELNPGKIVDAKGRIRKAPYRALRNLFREIADGKAGHESPAVYFVSDALAARGNAQVGALNLSIYDIASDVAVRWIPKGSESIMSTGVPVIKWDGTVVPANEKLSTLLRNIPKTDTMARQAWRRDVIDSILSMKPKQESGSGKPR